MSVWLGMGACVLAMGVDAQSASAPASAADAVTLRDGQIALGQVVEPAPRGKVVLLIRREWVSTHLPDWAKRWQDAETPWVRRARRERRDRLTAWRRERAANPGGEEKLLAWLEEEIARLADGPDPPRSPVMAVQLSRGDVRTVVRRSKELGRTLRQGWLAGFADVETMSVDDLERALEGRGFALRGEDAAPVDSLLPIMPETDAQWQVRRAATEVTQEAGLRMARYQGILLPEGANGLPAGISALSSTIKSLLDDKPAEDPLVATFRSLAAKGRGGLVVTSLDIDPNLTSVRVESTLWVRRGPNRWERAITRNATVAPEAGGAAAGQDLAADPQVKAVFGLFESLGLGDIGPEIKARSLNVGAASQKALGTARSALNQDLDQLATPVTLSGPRATSRSLNPEGGPVDSLAGCVKRTRS